MSPTKRISQHKYTARSSGAVLMAARVFSLMRKLDIYDAAGLTH